MTSWRDRLSALAREHLPAELAAAWTGLFRPGIRLVTDGEGARVGRLGGAPVLPADAQWPEWPGRGPLDFLASVDCAALPRESLSIPLPAAGTLLFFYFDADRRGSDDIPVLEDVDAARVVFVPAGGPSAERAAPDGLDPYPARDLFGEVVATAPEREHILLDQTRTASGETLDEAAEEVQIPGEFVGSEVFGELAAQARGRGPEHQVGGFAAPVQGAVENEIAAHVLGGYRDPGLAEEAAQWVLLAQIDTDDEADMIWGDAGMLYWVIRSDDLEAGRFDRARCTLQCG
ncbi:YwqG family protein [Amycolatopsis sp. FBCC-B4732]|uniref:YwqG family protein n=1 Tax=Amycolatopsis sp. FBCC-B4732 TaxID=3079339 RepID=UPI001FF26D2B|nr:YwqG family protein [Amycolatopsis sp. FBCC-B4732]UOX85766.1 YwqG family protein [Amycolatopsis sp. FBCC-B4732]